MEDMHQAAVSVEMHYQWLWDKYAYIAHTKAALVARELARHFAIKEALQRDLLAIRTQFLKGSVFKGKCKHCHRHMHEDTTVLSWVESSTMSQASTRAFCWLQCCFSRAGKECL